MKENLLQHLEEWQEKNYQHAKKHQPDNAQLYDIGYQLAIDEVKRFFKEYE